MSYKIKNLKVRANSYNLIGYQMFPQDALLLLWKEIGFFSKIVKIWCGGSAVKNLPANRRHELNPWVVKIPWRRKQQPTPGFLPGKSHRQRGRL